MVYINISDEDLDILVRTFKSHKPASGLSYVVGFLRRHQVCVQRRRIHASLKHIDGLGQALQNYEAIDRDEYSVPHSNYLWHLDGHHKLIKWGIVDREPHREEVRELTTLLLKTKEREQEPTAGWRGEPKLYTLHHTPNHNNSNTLERLRAPPKHFFVYFISLEFDDSRNAHPRSRRDEQNFKMQTRIGTRYTGAMTAVTKPMIRRGIFLVKG